MSKDKEVVKEKPVVAKKSAPLEKGAVMVKNISDTWFVQTGTNIRINSGATMPLKDDVWLELQIAAGYMEKV